MMLKSSVIYLYNSNSVSVLTVPDYLAYTEKQEKNLEMFALLQHHYFF